MQGCGCHDNKEASEEGKGQNEENSLIVLMPFSTIFPIHFVLMLEFSLVEGMIRGLYFHRMVHACYGMSRSLHTRSGYM